MASGPEEGEMKELLDSENNITIRDSTLTNINQPQINSLSACYKVICGCECCITVKMMHYYLLP